MNFTLKYILPSEAYSIRHPVLRKGKPLDSCVFDGDNYNTTFHLGIFIGSNLVGTCSFFKNSHTLLSVVSQYQLRGMAILDAYQSLGLGTIILTHGETLLKEKNIKVIWCNAREKAANFYKKNGT